MRNSVDHVDVGATVRDVVTVTATVVVVMVVGDMATAVDVEDCDTDRVVLEITADEAEEDEGFEGMLEEIMDEIEWLGDIVVWVMDRDTDGTAEDVYEVGILMNVELDA